jgi:hypothetical protein
MHAAGLPQRKTMQDRERGMRILVAIAGAGVLGLAWLSQSNPAEAHARYVKHRPVRTTIAPYRRPYVEVPPGYSVGGPNYTTCDRINRDRMLVGTCR